MPVVLVVEDEEPLQEIVRDALKEGGFDLTMVASGREAVAMIESGVGQVFGAGSRRQPQGIDERLGDWALGQANRSRIPHRLHDRRGCRRLAVRGSTQQHPSEKNRSRQRSL